jgi:hypothetical protein
VGIVAIAGLAGALTTMAVASGVRDAPSRSATMLTKGAVNTTARASKHLLPALPGGPQGPAHPPPRTTSAAVPVWLTIPSIGIDSPLEQLQLDADGSLAVPTQWGEAGWYAGGVRPGNPGPAVIAGHVDSINGPAVFYRLREVRAGAVVIVREATGGTLRFIVDTSVTYPKDRFPTEAVYGPTPLPELRLITCTGEFDFQARSYLDNLVVSAHLAS